MESEPGKEVGFIRETCLARTSCTSSWDPSGSWKGCELSVKASCKRSCQAVLEMGVLPKKGGELV
eukprot:1146061-Pelagomonas_calceolata.AAC.1